MSSRRTLILIAAIVVGALAAFAIFNYVGGLEDKAYENAQRVPVIRVALMVETVTDPVLPAACPPHPAGAAVVVAVITRVPPSA